MKILKTDNRVINEGNYYRIEGDIVSNEGIDFTDLDKGVKVSGYIESLSFIKSNKYIESDFPIVSRDFIECNEYIISGMFLSAETYIKSGDFIRAGTCIECGGSIEANSGILASHGIKCVGTLSVGTKAFAGVCYWREISEEEKTITCSKFIGGGVVEYGILKETDEGN